IDTDVLADNTGLEAFDALEELDDLLEDLGFEKIGRSLYYTKEDITAVHDTINYLTELDTLEDAVMNAIVLPTSEIADFTEYFDQYDEDDDDEEDDDEDDEDDEDIQIEIE
ncbi:MAG: hypothetical protein SPJ34_07900, partial [Candidatus Ornithospirochaeta sp.]|nr:hypothetical protein [Candidatus Ornithospirochaeta sp.]